MARFLPPARPRRPPVLASRMAGVINSTAPSCLPRHASSGATAQHSRPCRANFTWLHYFSPLIQRTMSVPAQTGRPNLREV
jgi:hypothetical protein